jgi:H+/Cl- antiporter ClcA
MAIKQRWSVRFGPIVVVIAFVGLGVTVVSKESGQEFAQRVGTPQPHAELADTLPYFALALFVTVAALWLLDRNGSAKRKRPIGVAILAIVVIAVAALTTLWTIRVGHSGSEAVWQEIVQKTQ